MTEALDTAEQKAVNDVEQYGWHCIKVFSLPDDPVQTTFAYTVGLHHTHRWPELICFGLETDTLHKLLSNAIGELRHSGMAPKPGVILHEVMEAFPCRLIEFSSSLMQQDLGWALWFAQHKGYDPSRIQCLQLVWPDRHGRFPDDPNCIADVRLLQTPAED